MAIFSLKGVSIEGIACAVPDNVVDNFSFIDKYSREYVEKFIQTTGVKETHRTTANQTASDLCYIAAKELIEKKGINTDEIGACIFISQTPDYRLPATACVLHKRLGLNNECVAFDINLGCSGWVYGVNAVGALLMASNIDNALFLFGDTNVKTISPEDKSSYMLFGEAGSATLLTRNKDVTIDSHLCTDGTGYRAIIQYAGAYRNPEGDRNCFEWGDGNIRSDYDAYINGTDVFSFTITQVPKLIKRYMKSEGLSPNEFDGLILHQANMYIMQQIAKKTGFSEEKLPITIDRFGNTSGTSIPLTLCDKYSSISDKNLRFLCCGYGIGLSWGVLDLRINSSDIFPIVETSDYYTDGGISHE